MEVLCFSVSNLKSTNIAEILEKKIKYFNPFLPTAAKYLPNLNFVR
jgi:hypothetical protein